MDIVVRTGIERRVVVIEDEPLMRALITSAVERAGFNVRSAANAADAKRVCDVFDPDALLVDIELGAGPTGLDLVEALLHDSPHLGVVFLSRVPDARFVAARPPLSTPNIAWLRKQDVANIDELLGALEKVLQDDADLSLRADLDPSRPLAGMTGAQVQLLRMVAQGMSNSEIAKQRGSSVRAVEHLIRRTFASAGIESNDHTNARVVAARLVAREAGLPDHAAR
jgi:DNA-binding NarL/FixJ family response regulator